MTEELDTEGFTTPEPTGSVANKVAIVTGASRGLGAEIARLLARRGASVVVAATTESAARAVADVLDGPAWASPLEAADEASWDALVSGAVDRFAGVDILVNNAAVYQTSLLAETSAAEFRRVVEVDQVGVFLGMRAVIAPMRARAGGSIVNVGSIVAHNPYEGTVAYAGAKAAVAGMTRVAAMELGRFGIRVNVVNPGGMQTSMSSPDGAVAPFFARIAAGRIATPVEVARVVAFLASDESSYCTGSEFRVDGGWSLGRYRSDMASG